MEIVLTHYPNFDQSKTRMLLMVGAKTAVVWTSPLDRSVVHERHLGRLDENLPAKAIVVDIIGNKDALVPMLRAALEEVNFTVLEDSLPLDLLIAGGTDRNDDIVKDIRTLFVAHACLYGRCS